MASSKDKFNDPITLEYAQLTYLEFAKVLYINYGYIDENIRALACFEFLKHYFFNTSDAEIELFKKRNPQAGMLYDILDASSEQRQNDARWASWQKDYKQRDDVSIEDIIEEKQIAKKEKKKELNRKSYQRKKTFEQLKAEREKEVEAIIKKHLERDV